MPATTGTAITRAKKASQRPGRLRAGAAKDVSNYPTFHVPLPWSARSWLVRVFYQPGRPRASRIPPPTKSARGGHDA